MSDLKKQVLPPFAATDLDGLLFSEAFQKFVIKDADLQAIRSAVVAEDPLHQRVFDEGRWPGLYGDFVWPINPKVGELVDAFGRTNVTVLGGGIFDRSPSDAVRRTAALIVDRCESIFGFLRLGEVVATGTYVATGIDGPLSKAVWSRKRASVDIATSDFIDDVAGKDGVRWSGLVLSRRVKPVVVGHVEGATAAIRPVDSYTPPAGRGRCEHLRIGDAKRRGRKPKVLNQVMTRMRDDIAAGTLTPSSLDAMIEKELETFYGHSRDTCRKARQLVLADRKFRSKRD
jgi:hypothetical protein